MEQINMKTKELLVGLILSDGYVGRSGNGSFIALEQTSKHKGYVSYVHNLLTNAGYPCILWNAILDRTVDTIV